MLKFHYNPGKFLQLPQITVLHLLNRAEGFKSPKALYSKLAMKKTIGKFYLTDSEQFTGILQRITKKSVIGYLCKELFALPDIMITTNDNDKYSMFYLKHIQKGQEYTCSLMQNDGLVAQLKHTNNKWTFSAVPGVPLLVTNDEAKTIHRTWRILFS